MIHFERKCLKIINTYHNLYQNWAVVEVCEMVPAKREMNSK